MFTDRAALLEIIAGQMTGKRNALELLGKES
jgi:hypothetical protein